MTIKDQISASTKPVIEQARFVSLNQESLNTLANELKNEPIPEPDEFEFAGRPEEIVQLIFFIDSIQSCFWQTKGRQRWHYNHSGEWMKGYFAFVAAIEDAVEKNRKLLVAEYLSKISFEEFKKIFIGRNELLLLKERHQIINENFQILLDKYQGQATNIIKSAKADINSVVDLLISDFPSFRDIVNYYGHEVLFLKRAQIFVSDVYFALRGKGLGEFSNLDDLSVFADYKIPQLLQAKGVLVYNPELLKKIRDEESLSYGSDEEIEIRAFTIQACDLLVGKLQNLGRKINHNTLDRLLWYLAKNTKFEQPYHKTLTIFY